MVFVTTGSQQFQFNRLLREIDNLIESDVITDTVYAQIGYSDYKPQHYEYCEFMGREEFEERISACDTVITHGGTGGIIQAVKKGKKVIAVPRLAEYGEHVDDHQVQLLKQFDGMSLICACYKMENLKECVLGIKDRHFMAYQSNTQRIIRDIEDYINGFA